MESNHIDNISNNYLPVKGKTPPPLEAVFPDRSRITFVNSNTSIVLNAQSEQGCPIPVELSETLNTLTKGNDTLQGETQRSLLLRPPCVVSEQDTGTASNYYLPQVWATWLSEWEWDWYMHLTFEKYNTHPERACKTWDMMICEMNKRIFGNRFWKHPEKGIIWARSTEFQKRGAPHFHAVAGNIPEQERRMDFVD